MSESDKVVYLGVNAVSRRDRELLRGIHDLLEERAGTCLNATLDQADDALFDRAERAGSDAAQEAYFVAMRQIRLQRRLMVERFHEALDRDFRRLALGEAAPSTDAVDGDGGWQLMDNAAVEEDVAIDTTVRRVRGRTALALSQIEARLASLVSGGELREGSNPVGPRVVVAAFSSAIGALEMEIQPRVILYKLFEKQLLAALPDAYEAINRSFVNAGVLPELKPGQSPGGGGRDEAARKPATGTAAASGTPEDNAQAGHEPAAAAPPDNEVVRLLHELIAETKRAEQDGPPTQGGAPAAAGSSSGSAPVADTDGMLGILSTLQRSRAMADGQALGADRLKTLIARGVTRGAGEARLERSADDTIDIVSMLFDVILEDSRLPDPMKALLARLQIPVLKIALADREFLGSRNHPARRLINALSRAATGWTVPDDPQRDPLYREVQRAVEDVVENFTDDAVVFEQALERFEAYQREERARAEVVEDRTRQAVAGKARVDDARATVEQAIECRLADADPPLPDVVARLLREGWFKVLFITAVKEGTDSDAWHSRVAIMDRLVWSVRAKGDAADRKRMLDEMPGLLHDLREGLNTILFSPFEMTRLFRELEAEHLRLLSDSGAADGVPPTAPETGAAGDAEADNAPRADSGPQGSVASPGPGTEAGPPSAAGGATPVGQAAPADAGSGGQSTAAGDDGDALMDPEIAAELRATALGTWFEFVDASGHRNRAKLSARLNDGTRYIFVNRAGFKVADRDITRLCAEIANGDAAPVDDNALFDRALESVITNLRDMRAGRAH